MAKVQGFAKSRFRRPIEPCPPGWRHGVARPGLDWTDGRSARRPARPGLGPEVGWLVMRAVCARLHVRQHVQCAEERTGRLVRGSQRHVTGTWLHETQFIPLCYPQFSAKITGNRCPKFPPSRELKKNAIGLMKS